MSVCSNVPGFTDPICFINRNPNQLVLEMVEYMSVISNAAHELAEERWAKELDSLRTESGAMNAEQGERANSNRAHKKRDKTDK